jgi:hypothetical protein
MAICNFPNQGRKGLKEHITRPCGPIIFGISLGGSTAAPVLFMSIQWGFKDASNPRAVGNMTPICRKPNCSTSFSKSTEAKSRPLPAKLVNAGAITADYKYHLDEAAHCSHDRVCFDCSHSKKVKTPTRRQKHKYASSFDIPLSPLKLVGRLTLSIFYFPRKN